MEQIGLIDCDVKKYKPKFPNLALMRISAYHKAMGDTVEWVLPIEQKHYNKVYIYQKFLGLHRILIFQLTQMKL